MFYYTAYQNNVWYKKMWQSAVVYYYCGLSQFFESDVMALLIFFDSWMMWYCISFIILVAIDGDLAQINLIKIDKYFM